MRGYWKKPEATAKAFTKGWLRSGDIARIDDEGFVFIVDRAKDMIIRGGENVYSVIVEAAIFEHPDVADCAVVGLPHRTMGEEVAAVIVLRPGRVIEAEEITRHVARHLARYRSADEDLLSRRSAPAQSAGQGPEARTPRVARRTGRALRLVAAARRVRRTSSSSSVMVAAAQFSSTWATLDVPGIGNMTG